MKFIAFIIFAIVFFTMLSSGCASDPALEYLGQMTAKIQPVVDASREVCNDAHDTLVAYGKTTYAIDDKCLKLIDAWEAFQLAQEAAIIAAGGEPCSSGCD